VKLVPYEHVIIRTALSAEEAAWKVESVIEPERLFRWAYGADHKPYQGKMAGGRFTVRPILGYRNSFLPQIEGRIEPEVGGCKVEVTMQPNVVALIFVALWIGMAGFFLVNALFYAIQAQQPSTLPIIVLVPAAMVAFMYGMLLLGFKIESVKSKAFFRELLAANQVEELGFGAGE
jgi:hypothetical protein